MKKTSAIEFIHILLGVNIILWLNGGTYRYLGDAIPSIVKFGLVALWFLISFGRHKDFLHRYAFTSWLICMFYLVCLFAKFMGRGSYFSTYGMVLLYIMIEMAILCYYFYYGTKRQISVLLSVFALDMMIILARTFLELENNPDVVRILSTGSGYQQEVLNGKIPKGIASYGFCYELIIVQPSLAYFLNRKRVSAVVKFLLYGLICVFMFQAQLTAAFIMYPILMILTYSIGKKKKKFQILMDYILIVVLLILYESLPSILLELIESSETHLSARLEELYNLMIKQDSSGSDIQARISLYTKSIMAFLRSPLWGGFGNAVYGGHATFLDMIAAFGLMGFGGYIGFFVPLRMIKREFSSDRNITLVISITIFTTIFLSTINVIMSSQIMIGLIVIMPLAVRYSANLFSPGVKDILCRCWRN